MIIKIFFLKMDKWCFNNTCQSAKETNKSINLKNMQYTIKDMAKPITINKNLEVMIIIEWMKAQSFHKMEEVISAISILIKIEIKIMTL